MEVVLNSADGQDGSWSCQISLRFMYDVQGKPLEEPQILAFGERLYDPVDVEKTLKKAQDAILHLPYSAVPDVSSYLAEDHATREKPVGFSRNVVRLDVCGPDLVDVTFIDLPGIIQNSEKVC